MKAIFQFNIFIFSLLFPIIVDGADIFHTIRYKNCKSMFEVVSVGITNCADTDRCQFKRNNDYSIQIGFKPDRQVDSLKTSVWAHLGDSNGALTNFHIENEDACSGANNITCPLEAGKTYWYTQSLHILPEYPAMQLQVNWLLINPDTGRDQQQQQQGLPPMNRDICIKFLAKVQEDNA